MSKKSKRILATGLVHSGAGSANKVIINSHTSGTLKLIDGTEDSAVASAKITSAGASAPASHALSKLTSSGASVPASHAKTVFTKTGNFLDKVKASAVLTASTGNPTAGHVVVVGSETYTFRASGTTGSRFDIELGSTYAITMQRLYQAILGNPDVDAVHTSTYVITVTAKVAGTAGNSISATENDSNLDWDGSNTTLTGGLEAETITIGTKVYTFKEKPEQANQVKIGSTLTISLANLKKAINASGTTDVEYGMGTVAHTQVIATASDGTTLTIYGRVVGTSLNTVATTETCAGGSWADTTLGGGTGASDAGVTTTGALVTIDDKVYVIVVELSETLGAVAVPYEVLKGVSEATLLDNLKSAVNGTTGEGTVYGTGTVAHPDVIATTNTDTVQTFVARTVGDDTETTRLNDIVTTTGLANTAWEDTTLGGGTGDSTPAVTTAGAEIVVGNRTYTAVIELDETSGADATADQVLWVTSEAVFLDNVKKAVNETGIAGTDYSTGTTIHTQVSATTNTNTEQTFESRLLGSASNALVSTTNLANYTFPAGTFASGTGATGRLLNNTMTFGATEREVNLGDTEFYTSLFAVVGGTADLTIAFEHN